MATPALGSATTSAPSQPAPTTTSTTPALVSSPATAAAPGAAGTGPPARPAAPTPAQDAVPQSPPTFERHGWRFEARNTQLWASERIDDLARKWKLCKVPDMFFGDSLFRAEHAASGTVVEFNAMDALQCCRWNPPPPESLRPAQASPDDGPMFGAMRCQFADRWRPHGDNPDVKEIEVTSDWTCSTPYWGTTYRAGARLEAEIETEETSQEMPLDLLRRRDEIHWYQEVFLWEDELADNGLCRASIRVRVMPTFWFALLLCELRVDNVTLREVATRYFFPFGSDRLLREWTWKEASYEALQRRGVSFVDNPHISNSSIGTILLGPEDVRRQTRHFLRIGHPQPMGASSAEADDCERRQGG